MDSSPTDADATGANTAANGNVSVVNGDLRSSCYHIRSKVFIEEQGVPADIERDSEDEGAIHVLAVDMHQQPCGAARLLIDDHDNDNLADGRQEGKEKTRVGKIGRVSVLQEYRGKGFGRKISQFSVDHLRSLGCSKAKLGAQTHAIPFYESLGFVVVEDGDEYMDAGIPHRDMEQIL